MTFHLAADTRIAWFVIVVTTVLFAYLVRLNQLLTKTPDEVRKMSPTRWSEKLLRETYERIETNPITTKSYLHNIPKKLERRYIVTGGSGECSSSIPALPNYPTLAPPPLDIPPHLAIRRG